MEFNEICFRFLDQTDRVESLEDPQDMRRENSTIFRRLIQAFTNDRRTAVLWLFGRWNISFAWILVIASSYALGEYLSEARKRKRRTLYEMSDELNPSKIKKKGSLHHQDIFMITMLLQKITKLARSTRKFVLSSKLVLQIFGCL